MRGPLVVSTSFALALLVSFIPTSQAIPTGIVAPAPSFPGVDLSSVGGALTGSGSPSSSVSSSSGSGSITVTGRAGAAVDVGGDEELCFYVGVNVAGRSPSLDGVTKCGSEISVDLQRRSAAGDSPV